MAEYTFLLGIAGLLIYDSPVGYSPPVGPSAVFVAYYNHREATQPTTFFYSNLGKRWTYGWTSYVEDDPTAVGEPIELFPRGGGAEPYEGFVNGVSAPQQDTRAVMTIVSTNPIKYERELPNGSIEVFATSDGAATAPRRIFLSEWKDPQGNKLSFTYDGQLRLVSVTDAIGQVSTLSYERPSDPLKITKVTDPFGRFATFDYDDQGLLVRITDVIGLTSEFDYGTSEFIRSLTTPYGETTFQHGNGPHNTTTNRWAQATDPLGGTERVEHLLTNAPTASSDAPSSVPTGFTGNANLDTHLSVYYSKLSMDRATTDPPDPDDGEITRFRASSTFKLSAYQIQSTKKPLEGRVWYEHVGETLANGTGPDGRPAMIGRVLDDGSSQIYRYEYNSRGQTTRFTDPLGRETVYEYASNQQDLLKIRQRNGATYDLLQEITYNSAHQPLTTKDAAGQTTTYTYNSAGQMLTVTSPTRAGTTENRTTTYVYDSDGHLESATPPAAGATSTLTYDDYGRIRTITDPENYTIVHDYDDLDRPTRKTYPDGTDEEIIYSRLDPEKRRDRLGRWTHSFHDALRRVVSIRDPLGATVSQKWCTCGSLEEVVDPNGNRTVWERDIQGRVTNETRADNTVWEYTYEATTSRLKKITDPQDQETQYSYFLDDKIQQVAYVNALNTTPNVSYTYDSAYGRPATLTDGTGTTTYTYHPVTVTPSLGAGRLSGVDGPYTNDAVSYGYDELGRIVRRTMNGVATTWSYDALGRVIALTDPLGSFPHDYVGTSTRLSSLSYPNGQVTSYVYHPNSGDKRLEEIHHRASVSGATLSKLNYVYDAVGNVTQWTQQEGASTAKVYDLTYDAANQLVSGVYRTTDATPTILKRYFYSYDAAGNRTVEQIDDTPVLSAYDNMNRLTSQVPGGMMRFAGSLNEAATVTVQSLPATVTSSNKFEKGAQVSSGTNQVVVKAKDYTGNERTNTYEVTVSGASRSLDYDANGNLVADGTKTYEWDAANRLVRVLDNETEVVRYTYDGRNRRSQKTAGGVTRTFVYDGDAVLEERPSTGSTVRYVYGEGIDKPLAKVESGAATYYLSDHLGSILQTTNASAAVTLTRQYDPWGRLLQGSTTAGYAFTGREWDPEAALFYYRARYYDPSVGRFISEDPLRFVDGVNPYRYARNNPIAWSDPTGLLSNNETCKIGCLLIITTFILWGCSAAGVFAVPCVIIALILLDICYKRCDQYCPQY